MPLALIYTNKKTNKKDPSEAAVVGQLMWYDKVNKVFKYKDIVFYLIEYNPNILVADNEGGLPWMEINKFQTILKQLVIKPKFIKNR